MGNWKFYVTDHVLNVLFRVALGSAESLMRGVAASARQYDPVTYCECEETSELHRCGVSLDVSYCDLRQGVSP